MQKKKFNQRQTLQFDNICQDILLKFKSVSLFRKRDFFTHRNKREREIEKHLALKKKYIFCLHCWYVCLLCVVWSPQFLLEIVVDISPALQAIRNYAENEFHIQFLLIQFQTYQHITNRSSADGPPNGTFNSSLCKS